MYNSRYNQLLDIYTKSPTSFRNMKFRTKKRTHNNTSFSSAELKGYEFVFIEDNKKVSYHYSKVFDSDDQGSVIEHPAKDLLGRPVIIGDYVSYAGSIGNRSALGFGKVKAISPSGQLTITPFISRGAARGSYSTNRRDVNIPEECNVIKAPITEEDVSFGILTDFDRLD